MNGADYLILGVLGVSALSSLRRGIISEVMSLAVWALALWVSATSSGALAGAALGGIEQPTIRLSVAFGGLFLGVLTLGGMVTWLIRRLVAKSGMSSTDRLLGLFFGLARGLVIVFSAVLLAGFTQLPKLPWWQESALIPALQTGASALLKHLPTSMRRYVPAPAPAASAPRAVPSKAPAPTRNPAAPRKTGNTGVLPYALLQRSARAKRVSCASPSCQLKVTNPCVD